MALIRRLARPFLGRRRFQATWERLHRLSLEGMNIGETADHVGTSGEALVAGSLKHGQVLLDVGAASGAYSKAALKVGAEVHAFEPDPVSAAHLRRLGGHVCIHQYGLGESDEEVPYYAPGAGSELASVYQRRHESVIWQVAGTVQLRALDTVCAEEGIARVDLLKLDVEGHEAAVLRGAKRMLREHRIASVQFEFGGAAIDSGTRLRDIVDLLAGFSLGRIVRDGVTPVKYGELWEIYTTTNFLAVRK